MDSTCYSMVRYPLTITGSEAQGPCHTTSFLSGPPLYCVRCCLRRLSSYEGTRSSTIGLCRKQLYCRRAYRLSCPLIGLNRDVQEANRCAVDVWTTFVWKSLSFLHDR